MKNHDVQSVAIGRPSQAVFDFISEPGNLPKWTNAFKEANARTAELVTPSGTVSIKLATVAHREQGTVDWKMTFPDGTVGNAYSRVTPDGMDKSIYSFVLMAPPVPLEMLEGALFEQMKILAQELSRLKGLLEG